ncbi:hypothetical protein ABTA49_06535 [Acinetobacter baumannii]|uniref:hypothetical protein n=1 Tax=Acinetobacter baumannii TaxID=470 RepID=UPI0008109B01|nr:hypothetical protein [Acinetobacter baumannii]EKU9950236.1 hypothetical protein [Acinetobacter baumannii]EKX3721257.1 hypothetical protein [Acinetobacter baumannii]EKX3752098.1 hypothetical protein [Acinetobacter baumannii]ELA7822408.1 hypothetical protein [Acinetobacter baumannii]MBO0633455.1 hypothetical protein [Acinetobacter baumannii]
MSTENLIELGKRLVEEFKLEDRTDTLSQWMLHYLAELFKRYDLSISPEEKHIASVDIRDTIFKLWEFRYQQSYSHSSFKNTESLISTLQKLNLDNDDAFYSGLGDFRNVESTIDQSSPDYWYSYALKLDKASKFLIRNCILKGYAITEADNKEISDLIKEFEELDSYENLLGRFYSDQSNEDKEVRNIKNNISKIEELMDALAELKTNYEEKLIS